MEPKSNGYPTPQEALAAELVQTGILYFLIIEFAPTIVVLGILCLIARALHRESVRKYEEKRRRRLQAQREERHRIKIRFALNPPPTPEALNTQWIFSSRDPEEALHFGSMLLDLEATVDNAPVFRGGRIVSRNPGLRGWLREHCPDIQYKTAMRYKSLADKYRQTLRFAEPAPVTFILPSSKVTREKFGELLDKFEGRLQRRPDWVKARLAPALETLRQETDKTLAWKRMQGARLLGLECPDQEDNDSEDDSEKDTNADSTTTSSAVVPADSAPAFPADSEAPVCESPAPCSGIEGATRRVYHALGLLRDPVGGSSGRSLNSRRKLRTRPDNPIAQARRKARTAARSEERTWRERNRMFVAMHIVVVRAHGKHTGLHNQDATQWTYKGIPFRLPPSLQAHQRAALARSVFA